MTRIGERDVLYHMLVELCESAARIPLYDADARESWKVQCHQLLRAIPDTEQKMAWTIELVSHLCDGIGVPMEIGLVYLLGEEP